MKQTIFAMMAAALLLVGVTGCSKDDNPAPVDIKAMEQSLVGLWWDEYEYADVTETGVPFSRVLLAVIVDADHTGCIYLGEFNDTSDEPLAIYGGPEEAGFTWQLLADGSIVLGDPVTGETYTLARALTRGDGSSYGDGVTDVTNTSLTYTDGSVTMSNDDYSGTLTKANAEQKAIVENMINGETFTLATLNVDGMPKQILFFDVNTEGPGEEYSPVIARYLLNKKFDIIFTQENFNYNAQLTAPFDSAGYRHDIWGGGIDVELAFDRLGKGEELEGIFHIDGLTAFWSPKLRVVREDSVCWKAGYGLIDHGWDTMVRKGFRSYDVTLSGGNHVVVYNMHMDASSDDDEVIGNDGEDRRARMVQWRQLRDHILAHLDSRPVIVTGDLNSWYERDSICSQVFSVIEQTGRATVGDAWITLERGGKFPAMVKGPVTNDPGSRTWALKGQTLDKVIYINPMGGQQLKPLSVSIDSATYVRADGKTPLGDHAPLSVKFRLMPR